jgi:hypothetical protein
MWGFGGRIVLKSKNTEIVVFDLELDIINSLANKHGLKELSRDMTAPEFHTQVSKITGAARIAEMPLPATASARFGLQKRPSLD